jgi:hypothetical protein
MLRGIAEIENRQTLVDLDSSTIYIKAVMAVEIL